MKVQTKRLASRIFRRCLLVLVVFVFGGLAWYVWPQELIRPRFYDQLFALQRWAKRVG